MNRLAGSILSKVFFCSLFMMTSVSAAVLEEVVVTAQKREQSVQDVGIAITAFSGEQIRALNFTTSTDIENMTPGMQTFSFGGGSAAVISMRGVGQLDFGDQQEQSTAVFIDGGYHSFLGGMSFSMYDIERVEVLKGPQGSLFGRNATGGVVHMLTNKPTREFEGFAEFQAKEYDGFRGEFAVSGPISETLSGRFSGVREKADGYVENSIGDDAYDTDNTNARVQFLFEPNEDLDIHVKGEWGDYDTNGGFYISDIAILDNFAVTGPLTDGLDDGLVKYPVSGQQYADFCDQFWLAGGFDPNAPANLSCLGTTVTTEDSPHNIALSNFEDQPLAAGSRFNQPNTLEREIYGATATINWNINDNLYLVSITDWKELEKYYVEDADGMEILVSNFSITDDSSQWSQELRLHGETENLKWVLGFYYLNIEHDMFGTMNTDPIFLSSTSTATQLETDTYAFFGHGEYTINDQWSFLAGLRWTEDEKDIVLDGRCFDLAGFAGTCDFFYGGLVNNNMLIDTSRSEGEWSGSFELNYRPNDDWLLYGKYSRGNKAGGFNTGYLTLFTPDFVEFKGEILTSYELGFKSTLWDGKARLNAAVFYYDYEDYQSFFQLGTNFTVQNFDANVLGGEVELVVNPAEGWDILLGLSLIDAEQEDVNNNVITRDRPMPFSPDYSFNGLVRYEWAAFLDGMMSIQFDWNYKDDYTMGAVDHPALTEKGFWLANARVGWASNDGNWELSAWVKNLTDEEYFQNGFDTSTFSSTTIKVPGAPQMFGGTIRYNWGG